LLSKHIIKAKDVMALLSEDIKSQVKDIRVMVNHGQPMWVVFLAGGGAYLYEPLNKDHEMCLDVAGVKPAYGKIYFCRKARILRFEETPEPSGDKYFSVFLCRPSFMLLWREVRELWFTQDPISGPGCGSFVKWFRHFAI